MHGNGVPDVDHEAFDKEIVVGSVMVVSAEFTSLPRILALAAPMQLVNVAVKTPLVLDPFKAK